MATNSTPFAAVAVEADWPDAYRINRHGRAAKGDEEAIESLGDVFGSLAVWQGLEIASRPPDQDHPYGHGKFEVLGSLGIVIFLAVASFELAPLAELVP